MLITLIDAHGPEFGLRVVWNSDYVAVLQWVNGTEGSNPFTRRGKFSARDVLKYGQGNGSQRGRVIAGAVHMVTKWGQVEELEKSAKPCLSFGTYAGEADIVSSRHKHTVCCGAPSTNSRGDRRIRTR